MNSYPDRVPVLQSRSMRFDEVSTTCQGLVTDKGQSEVCPALEPRSFAMPLMPSVPCIVISGHFYF